MNTTIPLIQVYDEEGEMLIPESATPLDNNNMTITFNTAVAGTAIVLFGDLIPQSGVGLLEPAIVASLVLVHTLDNPNAYTYNSNGGFFNKVDIDSNTAIIGAPENGIVGNETSGEAYIINATTGALIHTLDNPNAFDTSANDRFGFAVAISGNNCIVSADSEDDAGGTTSGKAYIFNVTTGALLHTLDNPNAHGTSSGDSFGISVAIDGNNCIVGAYEESDATGDDSGKAYIFNVTTGALIHTLDNPNVFDIEASAESDYFGRKVGLNGDKCVVGAYQEADSVISAKFGDTSDESGKAYVFDVTTGALLFTIANPNPIGTTENDFFGWSVSIYDDTVVVGSLLEEDANGFDSGKAYIFQIS